MNWLVEAGSVVGGGQQFLTVLHLQVGYREEIIITIIIIIIIILCVCVCHVGVYVCYHLVCVVLAIPVWSSSGQYDRETWSSHCPSPHLHNQSRSTPTQYNTIQVDNTGQTGMGMTVCILNV